MKPLIKLNSHRDQFSKASGTRRKPDLLCFWNAVGELELQTLQPPSPTFNVENEKFSNIAGHEFHDTTLKTGGKGGGRQCASFIATSKMFIFDVKNQKFCQQFFPVFSKFFY